MNTDDLIGLEVCDARSVLEKSGETDFKFVYYSDRKQKSFDKEIVTAARRQDGCLTLIVCRYLFDAK